ncbi:acyl-CoA synthetase [Curvivirga aplysinae]|uniref:acyl-CoA synthetase n=1 Tax=Curvivirga aplysinae TaxID=2529852 RepID=UPI0012BD286A|nr:acyl-CoA synthetase [Curvivirga aplysinae]MTI10821.1 AMP-dependent synthetase [Curvivirga aplysinae]
MLSKEDNYDLLYEKFTWDIPEFYNIGVDICDRQNLEDTALIFDQGEAGIDYYSFGDFKKLSNKLANALAAQGIEKGDRIGILLPQRPETVVSHIATYKSGCIAVPLFVLFGPEAIEYRAKAGGLKVIVTDQVGLEKLNEIRESLPDLKLVISVDGPAEGAIDWQCFIKKESEAFTSVNTKADDPALIIFTSGTTGQPKGALHAHRTLLGHLPCVESAHSFFPQEGDVSWTPADWAWIGGLLDVLLPSLHHGVPVVAYRAKKFDPEDTFALLARHKIRNVFFPPTALKLMRNVEKPQSRHDYSVRSIISGGESMGAELLQWGRDTFGLTIAEIYGQTECNLVVSGNSHALPVNPGFIGKPVPGHQVEIIDDNGNVVPPETEGNIAVKSPDPVMFLGYWNNPEATKGKFIGEWLITGDTGFKDKQGYVKFIGRDDDVITTSGYRVGPGEIEDCLLKHPSVKMVGVVGIPDPIRTERIKAFIILQDQVAGSDDLKDEINQFVRQRLAAHESPREIAFVKELPMTTTGKIMRRELRAIG